MTFISQHNAQFPSVQTRLWPTILKDVHINKRLKSLAMRDAGRSSLVLYDPITVLMFKLEEMQQMNSSQQ